MIMAKRGSSLTQSGSVLTNPDNLIDVAKLKYFEQKLGEKHQTATVAETLSALSELT